MWLKRPYNVKYALHKVRWSIQMKLCNRLKESRLQKELTQESLAAKVGVTRQTIIAVEKEKFVPSVKLALQLARALDSRLEDLFWLENKGGGKS
jgi:putative transcriptional regulator